MFISFEGIDGSGKTTQLRLLNDYLIKMGHSVVAVREPGGTSLSEKIRKILLDKENDICEVAELFLFEAARAELIHSIIEPALKNNSFVLSDRFIDSTLAYQGYGRDLDIVSINTSNTIATKMLIPNITFYLQLPLSTAKQRYDNLDRMEQSGDNFLQKVIDGFNIIASNNPKRIVIIDATKSIDEISTDIINEIKNRNMI
jgi:dTMP kinase